MLRSITADNEIVWNETTSSVSSSPVTFSDTGTRASSYPISSFTLLAQQDLPASTIKFIFSLRNTDCGQDPSPLVKLSTEAPSPGTPASYMPIAPKVHVRMFT